MKTHALFQVVLQINTPNDDGSLPDWMEADIVEKLKHSTHTTGYIKGGGAYSYQPVEARFVPTAMFGDPLPTVKPV